MRKSMIRFVAATLAGLAAVPAAANSSLATPAPASFTVSYADLNLANPAGKASLQFRIEDALDKACARPDMRNLKARQAYEECATTARKAAMAQLSLLHARGNALASNF